MDKWCQLTVGISSEIALQIRFQGDSDVGSPSQAHGMICRHSLVITQELGGRHQSLQQLGKSAGEHYLKHASLLRKFLLLPIMATRVHAMCCKVWRRDDTAREFALGLTLPSPPQLPVAPWLPWKMKAPLHKEVWNATSWTYTLLLLQPLLTQVIHMVASWRHI